MIIRRPPPDVEPVDVEAIEEKEEVEAVLKEVMEEYAETSDRLEVVRVRGLSSTLDPVPGSPVGVSDGKEPAPDEKEVRGRGAREVGGTSCTCRFSGWFDLEGGGRTTMKDYEHGIPKWVDRASGNSSK